MDHLPEQHRSEVRRVAWTMISSNNGNGNATFDKAQTSSGMEVHNEGSGVGLGGDRYYAKVHCGGEGYSLVVTDADFEKVWWCCEEREGVERGVKTKLRHLNIGFSEVCDFVKDGVGKYCAVGKGVREGIVLNFETSMKLAGSGASVPLVWSIEMTKLPDSDATRTLSELLTRPLAGMVAAMSYSNSLFHQTVLAKDRELKAYRDAYGALPNQSVPFNPDSYYSDFVSSKELLSKLQTPTPIPLGGTVTSQLPQHDLAKLLYPLFFSHPEAAGASPPRDNLLTFGDIDKPTDAATPPDCFLAKSDDEDLPLVDLSPPLKKPRLESYVEAPDEALRREELTQRLTKTSPEKKGKDKLKKKLKNVFK